MRAKKITLRLKRHRSIRLKMHGSSARPRLVVRRTLKNFHVQLVDDEQNKILLSLSTADKELKSKLVYGGNIKAATALGEAFSQAAKNKGVTAIVFDRAGYLYHGRLKAFAEAARKGGLKF